MSGLNHRKEVMAEVERLGIGAAIEAAENLVQKARREAGKSGYGVRPVIADALTEEVLRGLAEALVPFIKELITEAVAKCLKDGGTWKRETHYEPNEQVTSDGTLWLCLRPNVGSKPPGDDWRQLHRTIGRR